MIFDIIIIFYSTCHFTKYGFIIININFTFLRKLISRLLLVRKLRNDIRYNSLEEGVGSITGWRISTEGTDVVIIAR